ncbi:MAG: FtsX-like permease family protein, partial [Trueperella sp.]
NTMLMSVYERQRDIGVMKVIGASMRDIRWLFLVESSSIGFLGGVVGIVLSYGLSALINSLTTQPDQVGGISQIPPLLAVAAVAGATLVAMASGMVPARRAMRLSPLAAMTAQR